MKKRYVLGGLLALLLIASIFAISIAATEQSIPSLKIAKNTLELKDNVYMNFKVSCANINDTAGVQLLVYNAEPEEYSYSTANAVLVPEYAEEETGYLVFKYKDLAAREMTEFVYVCAYANMDGEELYSKPVKFSILQYAYNVLNSDGYDEELKELVTSMLEYGAKAQTYFKHNTEFLATDTVAKIKVVDGTHEDGMKTGYYKAGTSVTLIANEAPDGYVFSHWTNSIGTNVGTDSTVVIDNCTSDTYTAVFAKAPSKGLEFTLVTNENRSEWRADDNNPYDFYPPLATYVVTGIGECTDTEIIIPSKYNGYSVSTIKYEAFRGNENITKIVVPESVSYIGNYAFADCINLKSAEIRCNNITPTSGYNEGYSARAIFMGCASLEELYLSDVEFYYGNYLYNRFYLNRIMPFGHVFGYSSYSECEVNKMQYYEQEQAEMKNIYYTLPSALRTVHIRELQGSFTGLPFAGLSSVTNIVLLNGITSIPRNTFNNSTGMTEITIPVTVTSIGWGAFAFCTNLTTIQYEGTIDQWNNIEFGDYWNRECGDYTIICTDGIIEKASETE